MTELADAHRLAVSVRGTDTASYSIACPVSCGEPRDDEYCEFTTALMRASASRVLPMRLGVYDATLRDDGFEFTWVRGLESGDFHG